MEEKFMGEQIDGGKSNFLHHFFLHPSDFPPLNEENNKKSSIKMTSITTKEEKGFSVWLTFAWELVQPISHQT